MNTTIEINIVQMQCGECGIFFWVTPAFYRERKERGKEWCCPNGHTRVFSESDVDRLSKKLQDTEKKLSSAQFEIMAAERKVKRLETRAKNGVCPCCHRQFVSLARHIATKHSEYAQEPQR